ncbi:hypothetical protein ANN_03645 [Periplaneta americana]|uniref:Uncharacterized protein n=1 Tax=Periplaneta americana TaxID=6978 RepID=A0ABQ8TZJ9_PERAM|nr:hypothetical protein ANN_03645 [Periplaneta americana]
MVAELTSITAGVASNNSHKSASSAGGRISQLPRWIQTATKPNNHKYSCSSDQPMYTSVSKPQQNESMAKREGGEVPGTSATDPVGLLSRQGPGRGLVGLVGPYRVSSDRLDRMEDKEGVVDDDESADLRSARRGSDCVSGSERRMFVLKDEELVEESDYRRLQEGVAPSSRNRSPEDIDPTPGRENWRLRESKNLTVNGRGGDDRRGMSMTDIWPKDWGKVEKFKYLGATVTNVNDTREEIKRRINMGNACYYSVEKLLSSSLLSKNLKVRIYKTVILPVLLYGCETWTLTLREEYRLRVFENKVLRKIFGAKRDEVTGEWRKLHNTELHALYSSPDIIRNLKSRRLRWAGHVSDNAGEMSPGSSTESYPAFAHIGLRENPGKNLNQATCPDRESNPGHLVSRPDELTVTPLVKRIFSWKLRFPCTIPKISIISSHLISSHHHLISSHLISKKSHLISSHPKKSHHLISSHRGVASQKTSHLIISSSHLIVGVASQKISIISSHCGCSIPKNLHHLISSHRGCSIPKNLHHLISSHHSDRGSVVLPQPSKQTPHLRTHKSANSYPTIARLFPLMRAHKRMLSIETTAAVKKNL